MALPSIHRVRDSLADIPGALIDKPSTPTSGVDIGDLPCVPINQPEHAEGQSSDATLARPESADQYDQPEDSIDDDTPIVFEIPPELDERTVREHLGRDQGSEFERLIEVSGTDAIGWYFPFHQTIAQHGIYISSSRALMFALRVFQRKYSEDFVENLSRQLQYAVHAVVRHEAFHFATECMAANWELATGTACYLRAREGLRGSSGYVELEEALANAYMIRGFRWQSAVTTGAQATPSLKAFCISQPAGYKDGPKYVTTAKYEATCRRLAFGYHETMSVDWHAPRMSFDALPLFPNASRIDWRRCPVILVDERNVFSLLGIVPKFINTIVIYQQTDGFQKMLHHLGSDIHKKWEQTKEKLVQSTGRGGLDFKPWPARGKGWFSVRVDRSVRAHLRQDSGSGQWYAEEIGRHDAMGH